MSLKPDILITRPQRWDVPFGADMTDDDVDQLLTEEPFCNIDQDAFPCNLPLRGILRNDTRLVDFSRGDLIVREGDYGNSAFFVLSGRVRVVLTSLSPELLGRERPARSGWMRAIAQLWRGSRPPEVRPRYDATALNNQDIGLHNDEFGTRVFLQDVPRILEENRTALLEQGEFFGELAALSRTPRTATVFAEEHATLLEIRWQGLRDLMQRTDSLRRHIENLYRENSLRVHLRETPLLKNLPLAAMERVIEAAIFESYGNFDWHADFAASAQRKPAERIAREPLIAQEGHIAEDLLLLRSGFARLSRRHGNGHRTLAYLGKGQAYGLAELARSWRSGQPAALACSLRAAGYVDVLRIPGVVVREAILPHVPENLLAAERQLYGSEPSMDGPRVASNVDADSGDESNGELPRQSASRRAGSNGPAPAGLQQIDPRTLDFLVDHRFVNGSQAMLIDLERCTRCDDCVQACAATHDNNPRFLRHGPKHDHLMVANACMHCVDPVCMIGCPTGAIGRDETTGVVRINDRTCIGCGTCASSCPFDAIRMVEIRESSGAFLVDEVTGQPIAKATKCDLCADQLTGPACQQACPHDALVRIDMGDLTGLASWLGR